MNLVAYSWGRANLKRGDRVLLTEMEHHSNIVPWQILAAELGFEIAYVHVADDGTLILDDLPKLLTGAKLFSFTYMSNVVGTINPVRELTQAAHKAGALVHPGRLPGRAAHAGGRASAWTWISCRSPATRCSARPASARCGAAVSC